MKKYKDLSEVLDKEQYNTLLEAEEIITRFNSDFNILSYFEDIFNENVWTRIFAYILDSDKQHNLKTKPFGYWIEQITKEKKEFETYFLNKLEKKPFRIIPKTEWATVERRRIDLVLELNDDSGEIIGIIGLENKLNSAEQEMQISDYQIALTKFYPFVPKIILYCTPDGRSSTTALNEYIDCPYLPITYYSFKEVFSHFSNHTQGEVKLIFHSTYKYLEYMLAREVKMEILKNVQDRTLPFNERNIYSPVMNFFNKFEEYLISNGKFPFTKASIGTFSTDEIKLFVEDLHKPKLCPAYLLHGFNKEPRKGDYFVVRVMIHSRILQKLKSKDKQPIRDLILKHMQLPNTRNELKHLGPYVNIWTSNKYQLVDLAETDIKNMLNLLEDTVEQTYHQLKKKYNKFIKLRPDIAF